MADAIIKFEGDTWKVGTRGAERDGAVYCHLWSETRTLCTQKNGRKVPVQSCAWVPVEILEGAAA